MSITSFTYRSNLNLVYKESLSRIAAFLGVPVSKSAGKPTMIEKIDSYVKSNPIEVLEKLCVKELELLREFVKAGPDTPVVKVPRRTYDTLKMLLLVSVCYDKKTRKENLLMDDELRELFAPPWFRPEKKPGRRRRNWWQNRTCRSSTLPKLRSMTLTECSGGDVPTHSLAYSG